MIKWQLESNNGAIQNWIKLFPGYGLTDTFAKTFQCAHKLIFEHIDCVQSFKQKYFWWKCDSKYKTLVVSQKCLSYDTRVIYINQFLINPWIFIHRFTLSCCLLWDVPLWEHAKYEDSKVDSLENSSLQAGNSCQGESSLKETLPDHRSVFTKPEGSLSSQNEWQSHIHSLSLLLTVLFQGYI